MSADNQDIHYDVIVVGLGPAGANAAYHLARAGISTLAIEKKKMPRRKLCAGGISAKVIRLLDFDYSSAIEQEIKSAVINFRDRRVEISGEDIVGFVVNWPVLITFSAAGRPGRRSDSRRGIGSLHFRHR